MKATATELLARLDERLTHSPVRDGWIERSHFHDAEMDLRVPTHELTRAHAVLRKRRRILSQKRDWAFSREGLRELAGRSAGGATVTESEREGERAAEAEAGAETGDDNALAAEFAEIDAVLARSSKLLDGADVAPARARQDDNRLAVLYDEDWDEGARLAEWQGVLERSRDLPLVLRSTILLEAWTDIDVLQRGDWIGPLLVAAFLRQEGLCGHHLACLHLGAQKVPRERRRARDRTERLLAWIDGMFEAACFGLKEHDRLLLARERMERVLRGRRSSSKLPSLIELVLSRPVVATGTVQEALKVSRQGALDLIGQVSLREMTGRGSYRAWGFSRTIDP